MAPIVTDLPDGAPAAGSEARILRGEIGPSVILLTGRLIWTDGADIVAPTGSPSDFAFEQEKRAFQAISPFQLARFKGRFVASRSGRIVDSDEDLSALVDRFFTVHGEVPVYVTKIGEDQDEIRIDTPFFE